MLPHEALRAIGIGLACALMEILHSMQLRNDHDDPMPAGETTPREAAAPGSRLNLLLSCGGWRDEPAVEALPRLLEPLGISSIRVRSGEEAAKVIDDKTVHIAMVDLAIPLRATEAAAAEPGGARILQLLRRLSEPPPTVVVRPRQATARESVRSLSAALREGAFAVMDRPLNLEATLEVMRRILRRYYADLWPTN